MIMTTNSLKSVARPVYRYISNRLLERRLTGLVRNKNHKGGNQFDFDIFKSEILAFMRALKCNDSKFAYRYSVDATKPTVYSSVYACMMLSLLGEIDIIPDKEKDEWAEYFDSFQSESDGLFYDPNINNNLYNDTDWWGARHLALHLITAYNALGKTPKYRFKFLQRFSTQSVVGWLDSYDWHSSCLGRSDIDNKIMNVGCLLQYQRDFFGDDEAASAIIRIKSYLKQKIDPQTGLWGRFDTSNPHERSRMIQFAYHLLPIFFYDGDYNFDAETIVKLSIKTQNRHGGYGVKLNSSACEDIDSIYLINNLRQYCSTETQNLASDSINRGLNWILLNRSRDGGFVFRLFEPLEYGHPEMSSKINNGGMFPTWFRLLSIAQICKNLNNNRFVIKNSPGLEHL